MPDYRGVKAVGTSATTPLRFSQNYGLQQRNRVIAVRSVFSVGLDFLNATRYVGATPDARFTSWQGQFCYIERFADSGIQLLLRGQAQFTNERLLPLEKFFNRRIRDSAWISRESGRQGQWICDRAGDLDTHVASSSAIAE